MVTSGPCDDHSPAKSINVLQLKAFGGLWLTGDDARPIVREGLRRQLLLLALVAEAGERGISRDRAIAFFWPEGDEERGRRSLNQMRYTLRRDLGVDPLIGTRTLRADPANLVTDVGEFLAAIAAGNAEHAAALYAGPFLEGVFGDGSAELDALIEERRAVLKGSLESALVSAARTAESGGDRGAAVLLRRRLVRLDPLSTPFAVGLMNSLVESGDASGAIVVASEHETTLRRELETGPDATVTGFAAEIRKRMQATRATGPAGSADFTLVLPPALAPEPNAISAAAPAGPAPPAPPPAGRRNRWTAWTIGAVASVAALLVGADRFAPAASAAVMTLLRRPTATLVAKRVAVAPLVNQTGDSTLDAFGEMAADWIAQSLAETGQFDVVDPRTAQATAMVVARIPEILRRGDRAVALARETGAALSIGGSYYRDGDSLRALVRIVGTESGQVLRLVAPIAGNARDPGSLVTALARRTTAAVAAIVDPTDPGLSATSSPPPSYESYAETSQAFESFYRGDYADAYRRLRHAISLDSTYAPPILMLAYVLSKENRWAEMDSTLHLVHTRRVRLTPAENASLQGLEASVQGDGPGRLTAAREMLRLAPASTEAATLVAGSALRVGYYAEALDALKHVDPERGLLLFWPVYWTMSAEALHGLGQYREEVALVKRGLRQFPSSYTMRLSLVTALAANGTYDDALRAAREPIPGDAYPAYTAAALAAVVASEFRGHGKLNIGQRLLDSLADHPIAPSGDSAHTPSERWLRAEILYQAGRWSAADSAFRPLQGKYEDELGLTGRLATLAARLGRNDEALRISAELRARPVGYLHGRQSFWRAHIAAAMGQAQEAVLLLRDAYVQGYPMIDADDVDPHLDRDFVELLNDPALKAVMHPE